MVVVLLMMVLLLLFGELLGLFLLLLDHLFVAFDFLLGRFVMVMAGGRRRRQRNSRAGRRNVDGVSLRGQDNLIVDLGGNWSGSEDNRCGSQEN